MSGDFNSKAGTQKFSPNFPAEWQEVKHWNHYYCLLQGKEADSSRAAGHGPTPLSDAEVLSQKEGRLLPFSVNFLKYPPDHDSGSFDRCHA